MDESEDIPEPTVSTTWHEYWRSVGRYWWVIVIGIIAAAWGVVVPFVHFKASKSGQANPVTEPYIWIPIAVIGLVVAQAIAFHKVRCQRDAARQDARDRFDSVRYRFKLVELHARIGHLTKQGSDPIPGFFIGLEFCNASTEVIEYRIESMQVVLGDRTGDSTGHESDASSDILPPGQNGRCIAPFIAAPLKPLLPGYGEFVISYGHPTSARWFQTKQRFHIEWLEMEGEVPEPLAALIEEPKHEPFTREMKS